MISENEFSDILSQNGWIKFNAVIPDELLNQLQLDIEKAYAKCREVQLKNGVDVNTDGTVHHLLGQYESFLKVLGNAYLHKYVQQYFGQPYIINSYGGVINLKNKLSYVGNIHRDIRSFYNMPMMINMLIMLDDFTLENGATYFLTGSHKFDDKPDANFFYERADRAIGKAGDVILFDSLLWHAAGENKTDNMRRALTLTFTRPFMKPQLDYPRALGYDNGNNFSEHLRQVVGYNSRIPSSLDEWYQPPQKRFYKQGQG